jgi:hypothetical protein
MILRCTFQMSAAGLQKDVEMNNCGVGDEGIRTRESITIQSIITECYVIKKEPMYFLVSENDIREKRNTSEMAIIDLISAHLK